MYLKKRVAFRIQFGKIVQKPPNEWNDKALTYIYTCAYTHCQLKLSEYSFVELISSRNKNS